jgi:hypothetical protein
VDDEVDKQVLKKDTGIIKEHVPPALACGASDARMAAQAVFFRGIEIRRSKLWKN